MPSDKLLAKLITAFVSEAGEHCARVTREVLALERADDTGETAKRYDVMCRSLHSLKGSSAMLGLEPLSEVAHRIEDLVAPWRKALAPIASAHADVILEGLDVLLAHLRAVAERQEPDWPAIEGALARITALAASQAPGGAIATPEPADPPAAPEPRPLPQQRTDPPAAAASPADLDEDGSWRVGTRQVVALMRDVERLREVRLRLDERRRDVERTLAELGPGGELQRTRLALLSVSRALGADSEEASDILGSLEDGLKAICTLPVRTLVGPLERVVRDTCRQTGKEGRLSVVGTELALDRRVLESIKNPLVHLLRNAVDHGLEQPAERERRGKHREGALVIRLEKQANVLFVEVADDGAGIDLDGVRTAAIARGLVSRDEVAAMPPAHLYRLLFHSGFSTRAEVSETSGRGVGLDVVQSQVEALEGRLEVESTPGQGTRFVMILPAELGSSPVLQLRVGEHALGLPMVSVETILRSRRDRRRVSRARVQIEHGESLLPLVDLGDLLGLRHAITPEEGMPVLVVQAHARRIGVLVDEILGDDELVIRPLPREVREVPAYQGAATLARGELLLILRPDWLTDEARRHDTELRRRALVVDDSLTVRALHRTMLEAGGYEVHTASSGAQALAQLENAPYDVIVCDVSMEGMDGLAFTRSLRGRPDRPPVILVSAHDSDADRARGAEAGADGFLSKKECAAGRLLQEVAAVTGRRGGAA